MHLFFTTRGIKHQRDLWVSFMQSQMFPWKRKNLQMCSCGNAKSVHTKDFICKEFKPREETVMFQGNLQPIELWSYVFPEESLPEVLTMLQMTKDKKNDLNSRFGKVAVLLRKMLGVKKVPEIDPVPNSHFIPFMGFGADPIGIKEDKRGDMYGYEQEGL